MMQKHFVRLAGRCLVSARLGTQSQTYNNLKSSQFSWKLCFQNNLGLRQFTSSSCLYQLKNVSSDYILSSPVPEMIMPKDQTFHEYIYSCCDKYKDKVALEEFLTGKTCTFQELKEESLKVASGLHKLGLKKGDVVLIFSTNNIDFTLLMLACSYLGLWFSPANPAFTPDELCYQLNHGGAVAVFALESMLDTVTKALSLGNFPNIKHKFTFGDAEGFEPFQSLVQDVENLPDMSFDPLTDVLTLPYSSGTTGLPKGVMLTHHNCVANIMQTGGSFEVSQSDVALGLLPLYHIYGLVVVQFGVLAYGGKIVYIPKFEPATFLQCLQDKKVTLAHLVPPLIVFMAKHPMVSDYDLSSLRRVLCGAAPLGEDLSSAFLDRHKQVESILQGYGLTETSPVTNIDMTATLGSIGHMIANTYGKIIDMETGKTLGPGEEGEFCVKGPQVMKGYYNNQKATDDMISADGWLATGDIAYYDEDGKVYIRDRLKELIKFKGIQVPPAELEALLLGHSEVADAAVIGVPDEIAGQLPRAYVVKKKDSQVTEEELVEFIKERVAPHKRLRGGVEFIDEVPKNPSGKILRRVLRAKFL